MTGAWLDSNVIVYFITGTPKKLAEQSLKLMSRAEAGEVMFRIAPVTVAEVVWVLESVFRFAASEIVDRLSALIRADGIFAEEEQPMLEALVDYRDKNVDFVDAYLAAHARHSEIRSVATFDRHFRKLGVDILTN